MKASQGRQVGAPKGNHGSRTAFAFAMAFATAAAFLAPSRSPAQQPPSAPPSVPAAPAVPPNNAPNAPAVPPNNAPAAPAVPPNNAPAAPAVPPNNAPTPNAPAVPPNNAPNAPAVPSNNAPNAPAAPPAAAGGETQSATDPLGLKYRFIETYATREDPARPSALVEYKVGAIETFKRELENPEGAPDRQQWTIQTIYTERPAAVDKLGRATDLVRRYDKFRSRGEFDAGTPKLPWLTGLSVWFRPDPKGGPALLSLTAGRSIRGFERIAMDDGVLMSGLSTVLPALPVRVGDTWPIARAATRSLLGELPYASDFQLEGSLREVRQAPKGETRVAVIEIGGPIDLGGARGAVKARLHFTFEPSTAPAPGTARRRAARRDEPGTVNGVGWVSEVRMGRIQASPLDRNGRLQQRFSRELVLERRLVKAAQSSLALPSAPPAAGPENSWIVYDDPRGQFHLSHPQYLIPSPVATMNPDGVDLVFKDPSEQDLISIFLPPPTEDGQIPPEFRDPNAMIRGINDLVKTAGNSSTPGHSGWLPEAEWAPLGRKVFHHEVAVSAKGPATEPNVRLYFDYYLVLFERNMGVHVNVGTRRDNHAAFRKDGLALIRSLGLGPSPTVGPNVGPAQARPAPPGALGPAGTRARPSPLSSPAPSSSSAPLVPTRPAPR